MECLWHKKCSRRKHCAICTMAKKIHPKSSESGPPWWKEVRGIKPHKFISDKSKPPIVHMAVDDMTRGGRKYRPLCEPRVPEKNVFGYTREREKVGCSKCQEHLFDGTDARAEREKAERLAIKVQKKARIAAKRAKRSEEKANRKTGKKLRKRKRRKV